MGMPNGDTMVAKYTALLPFPQLPISARKCDVLSSLQQLLLSIVKFCDAGFKATLDSENIQLTKDGITTLSGTTDHINGIYFIPL